MPGPSPSDLGILSLLMRVAPACDARRQVSLTSRDALLALSHRLRELEQGTGGEAAPSEAAVAAWALEGLAGMLTTVEHLLDRILSSDGDRGGAGRTEPLVSLRQALLDERDRFDAGPGAGYARLAQVVEHLAALLEPRTDEESGS